MQDNQNKPSGCGIIFLIIIFGLMLAGLNDEPQDPMCGYSVEYCK